MKSIIIIIPYFGKWPEWFPLYLESCRWNPSITWLFETDCDFNSFDIPNVRFRHTSKEEFVRKVNEKLSIRFPPGNSYKICDLRPMTGILYEEDIRGYDFFGYGDIDVIYGDIRKFYTEKVLENAIISTHRWCISGHLALIRNEEWLIHAFRRIGNWKQLIESQDNKRLDEDAFSSIFKYPGFVPRFLFPLYDRLHPSTARYHRKMYFKEQFTTPLTPSRWRNRSYRHPLVWQWKEGRITAEPDDTEYIYLHFMNFRYARYMNRIYGTTGFWEGLPGIVHISPGEMSGGIRIDRYGFHALRPEGLPMVR